MPLAFLLIPLVLPGPLEASLLLAGTLLGCALIHHAIILRAPILWPLFGVYAAPTQANDSVPRKPQFVK